MSSWSKSFLVVLVFLFLSSPRCQAQTFDDAGLWLAMFAQGDATDLGSNERLKWWFDGHARFFDDNDGFGQSIVRPGLGWELDENSALGAGYGWIRTSPIVGDDFDEHRIWQQWTWSQSIDLIKVALRSRFEQRFVETGSDTGLRFRQLFRVQKTLKNCPPLTLVAWDELFVALNDTDWGARSGFDQNRVFIGFGFKPSCRSGWRTEIGYLNQTINVTGPTDRSNHILSLNFYHAPRK